MLNHTAPYARDLLRIALDLLDDEESLTATAMILGAIEVLDHNTEPAGHRAAYQKIARYRSPGANCRSCA